MHFQLLIRKRSEIKFDINYLQLNDPYLLFKMKGVMMDGFGVSVDKRKSDLKYY